MDIFGDGWQNHFAHVKEDWLSKVSADDCVLLGGDISWGISVEEAEPDYSELAQLPGRKIVLRGNHDYYWTSLNKMRAAFPDFDFLQNNCIRAGEYLIAGSRGWNVPDAETDEHDLKIYKRELIRLELSLKNAAESRRGGDKLIALLHYPPFDAKYGDSDVTQLLRKYGVDTVLYGHLHGKSARVTPVVVKDGIRYYITSCDLVDNRLVRVY